MVNIHRNIPRVEVESGVLILDVSLGHDFSAGDHFLALFIVISVISGGANSRIGGPQVPVPRLT